MERPYKQFNIAYRNIRHGSLDKNSTHNINIMDVPAGIYFLELEIENMKGPLIEKIVISN